MRRTRLGRFLRGLGTYAAADQVDHAIHRSCIGRIVSLLTLLFILLFGCSYLLVGLLLSRTHLSDLSSGALSKALVIGFVVGLLLCIIVAGIIGNWLRHLIWRALRRRHHRRMGL
jgi:uncharacterized membrane protein